MLQKFEVTGIHFALREDLRTYVTDKLGKLDRYLPKHSRVSAHMEVRLFEAQRGGKKEPECEVTLFVPRETINLHEHAGTIYAAVDRAEVNMKQLIKKYKDSLGVGERRQHMLARLRRKWFARMPEVTE